MLDPDAGVVGQLQDRLHLVATGVGLLVELGVVAAHGDVPQPCELDARPADEIAGPGTELHRRVRRQRGEPGVESGCGIGRAGRVDGRRRRHDRRWRRPEDACPQRTSQRRGHDGETATKAIATPIFRLLGVDSSVT